MDYPTPQGANSETFTPPPLDGSLLLADAFHFHAKHSPQHPLLVYPGSNGAGKQSIVWGEAFRVSCAGAKQFRGLWDVPEGGERPVIAILAIADQVTYFFLVTSIMLAGGIPFAISPRNSDVAVAHLLRTAKATEMLVSTDLAMQHLAGRVKELLTGDGSSVEIRFHAAPTFASLWELPLEKNDISGSLPATKYGIVAKDTAFITHSSGSTAFPKVIYITQKNMVETGRIPYYGELDLCGEVMSLHPVPMFHMLGLIQFAYITYAGLTLGAFSPYEPPVTPNPAIVYEAGVACDSTIVLCPPSFIEAWAMDPRHVKGLPRFKAVIFGGGPLSEVAGLTLIKNGVRLVHLFGSTEAACVTLFVPKHNPIDTWDFFAVRLVHSTIRARKVAEQSLQFSPHCSPVFIPSDDYPGLDVYHLIMKSCPTHTPSVLNTEVDGVPAFDTKDLLFRCPKNPNLWKVFGRQDDQIMHSNGEKTNPAPIETLLMKDPNIKHAIVFGRGEFHAGVMIVPGDNIAVDVKDEDSVAQYRRKIWPMIERANEAAPTHSRIFKEMILVADPTKPFELTAKGTLRRQVALKSYQNEIKAIYAAVAESSLSHILAPESFELESVLEFVRAVVKEVVRMPLQDGDDLFQYGCDSLQATWIRNSILRVAMTSQVLSPKAVPMNLVYDHPSIEGIAQFLVSAARGSANKEQQSKSSAEEMRELVAKYTAMPFPVRRADAAEATPTGVLVTGTTGALGSQLLAELLRADKGTVYALNRFSFEATATLEERQRATFENQGLDVQLLQSSKLRLLEADLALPDFGLGVDAFAEMRQDVSWIIHNAWNVNFKVGLASLEPNIAGTRALIDFALSISSSHPPKFFFMSSIGVFRNMKGTAALEEHIPDAELASGQGYAASKWVTEEILAYAAAHTDLKPVVLRVGQLSGADNGAWRAAEWFPSLLRQSERIGALPILQGNASWIPVHAAAKIVLSLRDTKEAHLHITHPRPVPTATLLQHVSTAMGLPLVPFTQWFAKLEAVSDGTSSGQVQLLDFYKSIDITGTPEEEPEEEETLFRVAIDNTKARAEAGSTLCDMPVLGEKDVELWVSYVRESEH
ncbi:Acetyl-CoA synthetase-like protein [Mycena kentingensis (nom. inval.)]|nr:Acetyl-CoA synthetase-like protein [Mycena kentingensis (nom. inval.)]